MEKDYGDRVAAFMKTLQPVVEAEKKYFRELPIGSRFWVPCAGVASEGIIPGHVGIIITYAGNSQFTDGDWISREEAQVEKVTLKNSHGLCPPCSKIVDDA